MKLRELSVLGVLLIPQIADAGGLFLPGSGAISTSRAGAAVASADDGEALGINPAGLSKSKGTTITIAATLINFSMQFQRTGTYDALTDDNQPYEGQAFPLAKNDPDLPLGIGHTQPVPVIAIVSDLGGRVPNLHVAAGLYAPNAYPFRDLTAGYQFNGDFAAAPPPTRYDIMKQEAAVLFPSVAASYRINDQLDIGGRFSWGIADLKSTVAVWGSPGNVEEAVKKDGMLTAEVKDHFVPTWAIGLAYRPTSNIELGFNFNWRTVIRAKGTAVAANGPQVELSPGNVPTIGPSADDEITPARCASGGTFEVQKVCVDLQLPMSATIGGRYKFLGADGTMRGDVELNVGWENWGKRCETSADFADGCTSPGQFRVVVDAAAYLDSNGDGMFTTDEIAVAFKDSILDHRFKDTYSFRLGGSYHIPLSGENKIILRGGAGYDTRAAEEGWLRADIDGAARMTTTVGGAYRAKTFEINFGAGAVLEGENTNPGNCNPDPASVQNPNPGCSAEGNEQPIEDRSGPDPISPVVVPESQVESPISQGTYKSNYLLFMLGFSTWF